MPPKAEAAKATEEAESSSATEEQEGADPIAEEESSESSEESSTSENTDESSEEEAGAESEEGEESELDKILKDGKKEDNVQKRINQLTAQLKELKAENQKLQSKEPSKEPVYTEGQLKAAMKKAVEEGDADLIWDIIDYKSKQTEKDLVKRYEEEKRTTTEQYQKINNEWQKVTMDYSRVWEDEKGREIYPGAKRDLDITSEKSLLYQLATEYYHTVDDDGSRPYSSQGGQKAAVADALSAILRRKKISPVDNDKKKLERQLAKAKRQKALAGAGSSEGESPASKGRPKSDADALAEYIAERNEHRNKRINR